MKILGIAIEMLGLLIDLIGFSFEILGISKTVFSIVFHAVVRDVLRKRFLTNFAKVHNKTPALKTCFYEDAVLSK